MKRLKAHTHQPAPAPPKAAKRPAYCGPHATGQAYSKWPAGTPQAGETVYHGLFNSVESRENYNRWLAELGLGIPVAETPLLTIAEGLEMWLKFCQATHRYEKEGADTGTRKNMLYIMSRWVLNLYASKLIDDFGPFHLGVVTDAMMTGGLVRSTINSYLAAIRRLWDFFATKGYCSRESWLALCARRPLLRGEGAAETSGVVSVNEQVFQDTLPWLTPAIQTMLHVCCWSGCRKGEVLRMRTCDIHEEHDIIPPALQGKAWVYTPARYKTEHHAGATADYPRPPGHRKTPTLAALGRPPSVPLSAL